jgi:intracellular multiplication protein IcmK
MINISLTIKLLKSKISLMFFWSHKNYLISLKTVQGAYNVLSKYKLLLLSPLFMLAINNHAIAEEPSASDDYYSILQPGIHPAAPAGYPNYTPPGASNTFSANQSANSSSSIQSTRPNINDFNNASSVNKDDDYYTALKQEAFERLLNTKVPLSPEQIIRLNKELDKTAFATKISPTLPPQPVSSTITIDLSPGSTPPIVRLSSGFVSSLVFIDSTGQPWPIADYSLGNPQEVNIQWDKKTNALFIQSTAPYVTANLAIRLEKLDTPIMISLVTGQRQVDYRVDFQVRAHGPNALPPIAEASYPNFSMPPSLLKVLDGIPPPESKELQVSGNLGRAWLHDGKVIFRTNLVAISPAWNATVSSADGTKVYEFMQTPFILASKDGRTIKIEISGF